jgi:hypothetical protein
MTPVFVTPAGIDEPGMMYQFEKPILEGSFVSYCVHPVPLGCQAIVVYEEEGAVVGLEQSPRERPRPTVIRPNSRNFVRPDIYRPRGPWERKALND